MMRTIVAGVLWAACVAAHGQDTLPADSMRTDTLREVTVSGSKELPVETIMRRTIQQNMPKRMPTITDMLEKVKPGITDYIFYPLAIKERRREKRRKRWMKALERYDQMRTFDDLLHEAYERQMQEDSLRMAK